MVPQNPEHLKRLFSEIFLKNNNDQKLTIDEEEMLGLFLLKEIKDIHKLDENKFSNYKFRYIYLIYYSDLSFNGQYFKPNFNVKSSEIFNRNFSHKMNQREFNVNAFNEFQNLRRAFDVEIKISKNEILRDRKYLEEIADKWALEMLKENHSDQNLVLLSKETRDTIRKKNIEKYLNKSLNEQDRLDVFKAILKSKNIHTETIKILTNIGKDEVIYKLNNINIHYNYGSIIHIFNRHFAPLASNDSISDSKTFHSPKISLFKLHHILNYIFKKINAKKALAEQIKTGVPIFLNYKNSNYAMYLKYDNLNKSKININTFYKIDENTEYGINDIKKIKKCILLPLSSNLGIYKTSAKSIL